MISLPNAYETRMKQLLGQDFDNYLLALQQPPVRGFRVNTSKIAVEEFEKINPFGARSIPYVETGYYLDYDKVGNHPYHHAGMIYVQEPGAMAPAECVTIQPHWKILDLCAAPGGKSTQLKNKLGPDGILVSNEIIPARCKILTGNIERLGMQNVITTCMDVSRIATTFPNTFHLIMVDAPCSGEGMFRKEPAALSQWSQDNVAMCAARQLQLLEKVTQALLPGGIIIYATCTFSLEENEMVVDQFLAKHPEFSLQPVNEPVKKATSCGIAYDGCISQELDKTRRFYPHKNCGEGQYMAVLKHNGKAEPEHSKRKALPSCHDSLVHRFLSETLTHYDSSYIREYLGNPVYFAPDFPLPQGAAFCCGITIGQLKKSYLQPHHQFFMAMGKQFRKKIPLELDDPRLAAYLRGEEVAVDCENGWAVIMLDGCPLGGVKVSQGKAKNHYPKGLRLL